MLCHAPIPAPLPAIPMLSRPSFLASLTLREGLEC